MKCTVHIMKIWEIVKGRNTQSTFSYYFTERAPTYIGQTLAYLGIFNKAYLDDNKMCKRSIC